MNKKTDIIIEFSPNYKDIKLIFDKSIEILSYNEHTINGIQKYRINTNNKEIILNINQPQRISKGNYLFRYYFIKNNDYIFEYKFDKFSYIKKKIIDEDYKTNICLEFNKFEIFYNKTLVSYNISNNKENEIINGIKSGIRLKIYGFLYNSIEYNELLNTSAFSASQISYENNTEINYSDNNIFEICFMKMSKAYFLYDMQIKINIIFNDKFFKEDSLSYSLPINLTEELDGEKNNYISNLKVSILLIIIIIIIIIAIIVSVVFIILYFKLKKKNKNLEELAFPISHSSINDEEIIKQNSKEKLGENEFPFV